MCALYPETEYKSMLETQFGKKVVFRQNILESVRDVQELLRPEFETLVSRPEIAESEKTCFHNLSEILKSAEDDPHLRTICDSVRSCPGLGETFDFRWQSMDRARTFQFFDIFCVCGDDGDDDAAKLVSRAADVRGTIAFRLQRLKCDVYEPAEPPARCYRLSEAQFAAMLVLNDTTCLQRFEDVFSGESTGLSGSGRQGLENMLESSQKLTQRLESSQEVLGRVGRAQEVKKPAETKLEWDSWSDSEKDPFSCEFRSKPVQVSGPGTKLFALRQSFGVAPASASAFAPEQVVKRTEVRPLECSETQPFASAQSVQKVGGRALILSSSSSSSDVFEGVLGASGKGQKSTGGG